MDKEANIFSGGMMSDIDIKSFWGKGTNIFSSETGELAFNLEKQLQLGSIDLHFRHEYSKIRLSNNEILTYEMLKQHDYTKPSVYISEELTIPHGQSDHLSRRFRSLISEMDSRWSKSFL